MQKPFQYMIIGASLVCFMLLGVFAFILLPANASEATYLGNQSETNLISFPQSDTNVELVIPSEETMVEFELSTTKTSNGSDLKPVDSLVSVEVTRPATNNELFVGTKEHPQTDLNIIQQIVIDLITKDEAITFGQSGWLHTQEKHYTPIQSENTYNGVSINHLYAQDGVEIVESWYEVNEHGAYGRAITIVHTEAAQELYHAIFADGQWANSGLIALGLSEPVDPTVVELQPQFSTASSGAVAWLRHKTKFPESCEAQGWLESNGETQQYIVIGSCWNPTPVTMQGFEGTVLGTKEQFVFDWNTGRLLSIESYMTNENNEELLIGSTTYLSPELLVELPEELEKLLSD